MVESTTLPQDGLPAATDFFKASPPSAWRFDLVFIVLSLGLALLVFGKAFTGQSLLAPLDLGPNLYPHYHWLEPQANGIPKNHWVSDIFDHELPRQYSI